MRRGQDQVFRCDALDEGLLDLLARDPRMSNRDLARHVGVTEETVAIRLRRMLAASAMAMTALIDWEAAGYRARALVRLSVRGGASSPTLKALAAHKNVHLIAETVGCCDAYVALLGRDLSFLHRTVVDDIRSIPGITDLKVDVVTETCRYETRGTTLPMPAWAPADLPDPVVDLDARDLELIEQLISNAHESNRELARRMGVSDGTVRSRIQRLTGAGLLRIASLRDTIRTGELSAAAFVFITVEDSDQDILDHLCADARIGTVERCVGQADLVVLAVAATADELNAYISREVSALPGVARIEVAAVLEALRHQAHLARLLG